MGVDRLAGARSREVALAELLAEVRRIEVQTRRLVTGVMAGEYASVFRGSGIEFDEVREYVEGDDPRAVDWNVTARVGRPFVKKFVDERDLALLFLFDLSASMSGGFGLWSARETAARVCACLALSAVKNNDRIGLIAFSESVEKVVPPKKGISHALSIVRDCLALPVPGGRTDPAAALDLAARAIRRHALVFLVSDFLFRGFGRTLAACARRHDVIAVRLLTPELADIVSPAAGLVRVRDPESAHETVIDFASPRVRAAYAERVARWRKETEEELRRSRVDLLDVPVPRVHDRDAVARPILDFFRMRELRRTKR